MHSVIFEQAGHAGAHLVQIAADVESVERFLTKIVESPVEMVQAVNRHTLEAGGKRLRPAFLILAARATGREFASERAIKLGAVMEMIHMATLIHDDVIDEAALRRGRPTASSVFGNTGAILSGDVLLAKAMKILAEDGDLDMIRASAEMVIEMAEGEAREVEIRGDFELGADAYFEVLRKKTAAFVECCCKLGAMLAGADEDQVDALGRYGHHLGLAFQIIDDVLDYRGQPDKTGKVRAGDFREGCLTLPLIALRDQCAPDVRSRLSASFGKHPSETEVEFVLAQLEASGAYIEAEARAEQEVSVALEALKVLPSGTHVDLLEAAGRFVLSRSL